MKPPRGTSPVTASLVSCKLYYTCARHWPTSSDSCACYCHLSTQAHSQEIRLDFLDKSYYQTSSPPPPTIHVIHLVFPFAPSGNISCALFSPPHRATCWRRVHQRSDWKWECNASYPLRTNQTIKYFLFCTRSSFLSLDRFPLPASDDFSSSILFNPSV